MRASTRLASLVALVTASAAVAGAAETATRLTSGRHLWPGASRDATRVVYEASVFDGTRYLPAGIWVRDVATGTSTRVDLGPGGAAADGISRLPAISADGTRVAFLSRAANLVSGDTNAAEDVFVRDLATGTITRVSVRDDGAQGVDPTPAADEDVLPAGVAISADGTSIAFATALALRAGDPVGISVYVRDLAAGRTHAVADDAQQPAISGDGVRVAVVVDGRVVVAAVGSAPATGSVAPDGTAIDGAFPALSGDGRFLAFAAPPADPDAVPGANVYLRDLVAGTTTLASAEGYAWDGSRRFLRLSLDHAGRRLVIAGVEPGRWPLMGDASGGGRLTVVDRIAARRWTWPGAELTEAVVSPDGRRLVAAGGGVWLIDRSRNRAPALTCRALTVTADADDGTVARVGASRLLLTAHDPDGDALAFRLEPLGPFPIGTTAVTVSAWDGEYLVSGDTTVTVTEHPAARTPALTLATVRLSRARSGGQAWGASDEPAISRDARFVAFATAATSIPRDAGESPRWFSQGPVLIDVATGRDVLTLPPDGYDSGFEPLLSADGRFVAFARQSYYADAQHSLELYDRVAAASVRPTVSSDFGTFPYTIASRGLRAVSADGRLLAFDAYDGPPQLLDRATGAVEELPADAISDDGRWVAAVIGGSVTLFDRATGARRTVASGDTVSLDAAGRFLAFASGAALVPGDADEAGDVYVFDRIGGDVILASGGSDGASGDPALSHDGRFVAFTTWSPSLSGGYGPGPWIVRRDLSSGRVLRVSAGLGPGDRGSWHPAISGDGTVVAYASDAADLVAHDTNGVRDVFATTVVGDPPCPDGFSWASWRTASIHAVLPAPPAPPAEPPPVVPAGSAVVSEAGGGDDGDCGLGGAVALLALALTLAGRRKKPYDP